LVKWARRGVGEFVMKRIVVLFVAICMICVSISGAAVSINKITESKNGTVAANLGKTSSESNIILLNNLKNTVDKYMSADGNLYKTDVHYTGSDVTYPWAHPLPVGDFVNWWIRVNYDGRNFEQRMEVSPKDFLERLKHPMQFDQLSFNVDNDPENDVDVYFGVCKAEILVPSAGIKEPSFESHLRVKTDGIEDKTARLEVWSEIHLNYGLIATSKSKDSSPFFNGKFSFLINKLVEKLRTTFENLRFTRLLNTLNKLTGYSQKENDDDPGIGTLESDDDHLSLGVGVCSPQGGNIPLDFEKVFSFGKNRIFEPIAFEHELKNVQQSYPSPLDLLFGFQSYEAGSNDPKFNISFSIEFDPAFYIRTVFKPASGYIYYQFSTGSEYSQEPKITFSANIIKGAGEGVELSLIFDRIDDTMFGNWMSFDLNALPPNVGFEYKASKEFSIGIVVSSPVFSGKVKINGIPKAINLDFDVDATFDQQGNELFVSFDGGVSLTMDSNLGSIVVYYPKLGPDEPDVTFLKVSGIPSYSSLSAGASLYVKNDTMLTVKPEGHITLAMSSPISKIETFYPKADASDPDSPWVTVPQGTAGGTTISAKAELCVDLDNFSYIDNYVYGKIERDSTRNIPRINGYLPGATDPIVEITDIPADSQIYGELAWNKLQGEGYASRTSAGGPDPIQINLEFGSVTLQDRLEIRDGHIKTKFHLAESGYFGFDTANEMIGNTFTFGNTETGNSLTLHVGKVSANNLYASWNLDTSQQQIQVEDLALSGKLSLFQDFQISAVLQGKNMHFECNWDVGEQGEISFDFTQSQPIEIIIDNIFPDNSKFNLSGGVSISQYFHFDIKWNWIKGEEGNPGYFYINEDTNQANFNWVFFNFTYKPDGYNSPRYGFNVTATNIILIVWCRWYDVPGPLPYVQWYGHLVGSISADLLWDGDWYDDIQLW